MFSGLDRDDLISGLHAVVERAHERGLAPVSIIGGAATRLAYFDRATTVDIDARIDPKNALSELIVEIAAEVEELFEAGTRNGRRRRRMIRPRQ